MTVDKWEPILFANVVALVPENPITQQGDQRQGPPQALIDLSQCAQRARARSLSQSVQIYRPSTSRVTDVGRQTDRRRLSGRLSRSINRDDLRRLRRQRRPKSGHIPLWRS